VIRKIRKICKLGHSKLLKEIEEDFAKILNDIDDNKAENYRLRTENVNLENICQEMGQENRQETRQEISHEICQKISQEIRQGISHEIRQKISQEIWHEISHEIHQKISQKIRQQILEKTCDANLSQICRNSVAKSAILEQERELQHVINEQLPPSTKKAWKTDSTWAPPVPAPFELESAARHSRPSLVHCHYHYYQQQQQQQDDHQDDHQDELDDHQDDHQDELGASDYSSSSSSNAGSDEEEDDEGGDDAEEEDLNTTDATDATDDQGNHGSSSDYSIPLSIDSD
jgi:hypothetical protein